MSNERENPKAQTSSYKPINLTNFSGKYCTQYISVTKDSMGRNNWGNPLRVHETIMINLNATNLLLIKNNPELCRCYEFKT